MKVILMQHPSVLELLAHVTGEWRLLGLKNMPNAEEIEKHLIYSGRRIGCDGCETLVQQFIEYWTWMSEVTKVTDPPKPPCDSRILEKLNELILNVTARV